MKGAKQLIIPSLSGFQYGYNTAIIAGALLFLTPSFSLTPFQEGMVVGTAMIGICLASFSGILSNYIGRKPTLFLSIFFFLLGCFLSAFAPDYGALLAGRLLVGFGSGMAIVVAPTYLVEVAHPANRGRALNLNQIGIASGSLIAYLCSYFFSFWGSWRAMFALGIIPAVIQFIGLFFIPESVEKASLSEASWKRLFDPSYLSRFKLAMLLSFLQVVSGANAVFFFAPRVFENAGFVGIQSSLLSTVCVGVIYLLSILVSFWLVDQLGRRFLLFASFFGMGISLLAISFFSFIHSPWLELVTLISILFYIASFSVGVGPIPPMVIGEMSPVKVRGHIMSLMGAVGWVANYLVAITFLPAMKWLSLGGIFAIYAFFCLLAVAVFFKLLPETKQKSLDEIEKLFRHNPPGTNHSSI